MCVGYVDDCIFFETDDKIIDESIQELREEKTIGFVLDYGNDVARFLGILIDKREMEV